MGPIAPGALAHGDLRHLAGGHQAGAEVDCLTTGNHAGSRDERETLFIAGERFRADAKAEGDDVVVGGWALSPASSDTMHAAWFSETLTKLNAPWAFSKGEAFKTIAAQELFAPLLCLRLLVCDCDFDCDVTLSLTGGTDNQGNTAVTTELMTTAFLLSLILMEVAAGMHEKGLAPRLDWLPRELNVPADDLTTWEFAKFNPSERVHLDWDCSRRAGTE